MDDAWDCRATCTVSPISRFIVLETVFGTLKICPLVRGAADLEPRAPGALRSAKVASPA